MLGDFTRAEDVYIICGYTDLRKSIDGLAAIVKLNFGMDPFSPALFLFCGKRRDRLKALFWEGDGFVLLYKRLENSSYKWPRTPEQARRLSSQEFRWLMEGLSLEQPKAIHNVKPGEIY
ncbi:MAG: IS66 family insertion sequence element accessory protein TnpB [Ruminiclostridium sp.]|nr:IS66 family insertion sequence element accessory protein TnpB [Ruminiclostridium sp.]